MAATTDSPFKFPCYRHFVYFIGRYVFALVSGVSAQRSNYVGKAALPDPDHLFAYDGQIDSHNGNHKGLRIQEGAVVKLICKSDTARLRNKLTSDRIRPAWKLGYQGEFFGFLDTDTFPVDNKLELYNSVYNFEKRGARTTSTIVYTARMSDNGKVLQCYHIDEDGSDSIFFDSYYYGYVKLHVFRKYTLTFQRVLS